MKRTALRRRTPLRQRGRKAERDRNELAVSRALIIERSEGKCEIAHPEFCTSIRHRGSEAHHVLRRSQGGGNEPDNLLWICGWSHLHCHANPQRSYELGFLKRGTS